MTTKPPAVTITQPTQTVTVVTDARASMQENQQLISQAARMLLNQSLPPENGLAIAALMKQSVSFADIAAKREQAALMDGREAPAETFLDGEDAADTPARRPRLKSLPGSR